MAEAIHETHLACSREKTALVEVITAPCIAFTSDKQTMEHMTDGWVTDSATGMQMSQMSQLSQLTMPG